MPNAEVAKMLPEEIGGFRAQGAPRPTGFGIFEQVKAEDYGVIAHARRIYASTDETKFSVFVVKTRSPSSAYALLTHVASASSLPPHEPIKLNEVGTASVAGPKEIAFFKGSTFVHVANSGAQENTAALMDFARLFAGSLETTDDNAVPVLVMHLPEWEKAQATAGFAGSLPALQQAAGNRPALDAVTFDASTEAVTAKYGDARLVIVEFSTPQASVENDQRINERIAQLRAEGQPVPSAYKRVGNYSVFVFDAPDAAAAEGLLAGVKYEKDVRWLGPNPHGDEIAQRAYTRIMTGMIVTVIKTTGLAIVLCLGIGSILGGVVFMRRRAQAAGREAFSDAGEMLRLNLVEDNLAAAPRHSTNLPGHEKN